MIKQFIRNENGDPIGIMVADAVGQDSFGIGYSIVKPNSGDTFDKELGMKIATNRAHSVRANLKLEKALQHTRHWDQLDNFIERASKYFQNRTMLSHTNEIVEV